MNILTDKNIHTHLINKNPELKILFDNVNSESFDNLPKSPYVSLIGAVIGQIIRYTQAKMVRGNLYKVYGNNFTIDNIINLTEQDWYNMGLDLPKVQIINNINSYILNNNINLNCIDDIRQLKQIVGVGEWTIDTTILTSFLDWDTFPCGDLFIRKKLQKLYNLSKIPTIKEVRIISEKYKPYRSIVAWYLWRWFN